MYAHSWGRRPQIVDSSVLDVANIAASWLGGVLWRRCVFFLRRNSLGFPTLIWLTCTLVCATRVVAFSAANIHKQRPHAARVRLTGIITQSECDSLISALDMYGEDYHRPGEYLCTSRRVIVPAHRAEFERIVNSTSAAILDAIGNHQYEIDEAAIVRTSPTGQPRHSDASQRHALKADKWVPNHTPHRIWSASVGCSAVGSYVGGQLKFWTKNEQEDESFALWTGDAVVFTSTEENIHSVEKISSGRRHQFLFWFTFPGGSPVHPDESLVEQWLTSFDDNRSGAHIVSKLAGLVRFKTELATHGLAYFIKNRVGGNRARSAAISNSLAWIDSQSLRRIGLSKIEARILIRMIDSFQEKVMDDL